MEKVSGSTARRARDSQRRRQKNSQGVPTEKQTEKLQKRPKK